MSVRERLAKLISVKSFITIALTAVFCYMAIAGVISAEMFVPIFMTIIAFYFGTQNEKKNDNGDSRYKI